MPLLVLALLLTRTVHGSEPVVEFLQELKSRGYYSIAIEYLDRLSKSGTLDPSIRKTIDFERGEVLVPAAIAERQLSRRQELLDQAKSAFERFLQENPEHSQAVLARGRLANVLIEQARLRMLEAGREGTPEALGASLREQSRALLKTASDTYGDLQGQLRKQLESIPDELDEKKDAAKIRLRDDLRAEYVHARFIMAMAAYERAQSWPEGSDERKSDLRDAEKLFGEVAKKYRRRVHGISALLFQGRCHQEMGDLRKALSFYEELLMLPDSEPVFRPLKTKALRGAMESWIAPDINEVEKALEKSQAWLDKQRPDERQDEDWTAVKWLLAQAYLAKSNAEENGPKKTEATQAARRWALEVAKLDSPFQSDAQALLADTGKVPSAVADGQADQAAAEKLSTFGEALAAAEESLSQRQVVSRTMATLEERLAQLSDGQEKDEVQKQIEDARSQLGNQDVLVRRLLQRAEQLVTEDTASDQVNLIRFYNAALYFYERDYARAAVVSEFLATRYPNSPAGQRAAPIALSSLLQMLGPGNAPWSPSLRSRIGRTARQIAERDPGRPEVADALGALVTLALQSGNAEEAEGYIEKLPDDSPKRSAAELAVGQALWNQAAEAKGEEAEAVRERAVRWLEQGLGRAASDEVSSSQVAAALLVAQDAVRRGQAKRAIEILEQPGRGPKVLADENHRLFATGELKQRTYALAITAYISALPEMENLQEGIAKALATLDQLKSASSVQRSPRMAVTYLTLARSLEQQIKEASPERRATLVQAFSQFLSRAAEVSEELSGMMWVAESYVGLADATRDQGSEDSDVMYEKALKVYDEIQQRAKSGQLKMAPQESLLVKSRQAIVTRQMGRFSESIDAFAAILAGQENQVHVQMEAAKTLQAWGDAGEVSAYEKAIQGDRPDSKTNRNRIWGYGRVGKAVAGNPSLRELFFEARFRLAECRFRWAGKQPEASRQDAYQAAEQDVIMTLKLYPGFGEGERGKQSNRLLREIRQAMGKPTAG